MAENRAQTQVLNKKNPLGTTTKKANVNILRPRVETEALGTFSILDSPCLYVMPSFHVCFVLTWQTVLGFRFPGIFLVSTVQLQEFTEIGAVWLYTFFCYYKSFLLEKWISLTDDVFKRCWLLIPIGFFINLLWIIPQINLKFLYILGQRHCINKEFPSFTISVVSLSTWHP